MAGKLCWALGLVLLFAAAVLTQAPLAVGLLGFFLLLTLLLAREVRYLRGKVEAELIVPTQPAVQGQPFAHPPIADTGAGRRYMGRQHHNFTLQRHAGRQRPGRAAADPAGR